MNNEFREPDIEKLLREALAQPIGERTAFVESATADADVVAEVLFRIEADLATKSIDIAPTDIMKLDERPSNAQAGAPDSAPTVPGYTIEGRLGQGGMGIVYKARHEDTGRLVALKIIRPDCVAHLEGSDQNVAVE